MSEYKEMHEPAQLEFCMIFNNLKVTDRKKFLLPYGQSQKDAALALSGESTIERIITVQRAIKTAMIAVK